MCARVRLRGVCLGVGGVGGHIVHDGDGDALLHYTRREGDGARVADEISGRNLPRSHGEIAWGDCGRGEIASEIAGVGRLQAWEDYMGNCGRVEIAGGQCGNGEIAREIAGMGRLRVWGD